MTITARRVAALLAALALAAAGALAVAPHGQSSTGAGSTPDSRTWD